MERPNLDTAFKIIFFVLLVKPTSKSVGFKLTTCLGFVPLGPPSIYDGGANIPNHSLPDMPDYYYSPLHSPSGNHFNSLFSFLDNFK